MDHYLQQRRGDDGRDHDRDARILRDRQAAAREAQDRVPGRPSFRSARQLVQVFNGGNMVALPDHFFACHPATIGGDEIEGGAGAPLIDTSTTIYVDFIRGAPGVGDLAAATAVGGRWVAEIGGCKPTKICVTECSNVPIYGALIQIFSGSTLVDQCVTDYHGCCTFPECGTFKVVVTIAGTEVFSSNKNLNGGTVGIQVTSLDAICCGPIPIPYSLTLTDFIGSTPFVFTENIARSAIDGLPVNGWYACHRTTMANIINQSKNCNAPNTQTFYQVGSGPVTFAYMGFCTNDWNNFGGIGLLPFGVAKPPPNQLLVLGFWTLGGYGADASTVFCFPPPGGGPGVILGPGWFYACPSNFALGAVCEPTTCAFLASGPTDCQPGIITAGNAGASASAAPASLSPFAWSSTLAGGPWTWPQGNGSNPADTTNCPSPPSLSVAVSA